MKIVLTAILSMGLSIYNVQAKTCVKDPSASYTSTELASMQTVSTKLQNKSVENSVENFAQTLCSSMNSAVSKGKDINSYLHDKILNFIGSSREEDNYKEKIQSFWNKFNDKLVCKSDVPGVSSRKRQHILKRLVDFRETQFVKRFMNGRTFPLNPNAIEYINGKGETLLDYLNSIVTNTQKYKNYDRDEVKNLITFLKKSYGAKTAEELAKQKRG